MMEEEPLELTSQTRVMELSHDVWERSCGVVWSTRTPISNVHLVAVLLCV